MHGVAFLSPSDEKVQQLTTSQRAGWVAPSTAQAPITMLYGMQIAACTSIILMMYYQLIADILALYTLYK